MDRPQRLIGYGRVSTAEQAASGLGLDAQKRDITRACELDDRRRLVELILDEGLSGESLERPGLRRALEAIAAGRADGLVVAKLDRLSRSTIDFGLLLEWFQEVGANLIALDLAIDTSTPSGKLVADVFVAVAEWERGVIAERTRAGLAALRARGRPTGRPAVADKPELVARILELRETKTLQQIADQLNREGVPTIRGGQLWRPSSVQAAAGYRRRKPRRRSTSLPTPRKKVTR